MSHVCPQCSNSIEADFGVVTCSQCHSVLFIDMDGNVQLSSNENLAAGTASEDISSSENLGETVISTRDSFQDNWMQDQDPAGTEQVVSMETGEPDFENPMNNSEETIELLEEASASSNETAYSADNGMVTFDDSQSGVSENSSSKSDISEVSEFSNSDQSNGPLSYTVLIAGIDTKDVRQQLVEALEDPKFQWDSRELMKKIKMGELKLENLNPVKASVLIHRLQELPVKVSWVQNVYA